MVGACVVRSAAAIVGLWVCLAGCKKPPRTGIPALTVPRARGALTLDGRTTEADWARSVSAGGLVDTLTGGFSASRNVTGDVRALWTDEGLALAWTVEDSSVETPGNRGVDAHLWEGDCVEVMLDPGGDGRDYYEMQVDPSGNVFDTKYRTPRAPRPFGITEWDSSARHGGARTANGYTVEMVIPWASIGVENPGPSTVLRGNFYLMDRTGDRQRFAGWSAPMIGDFHVPDRFGRIALAP